MCLLCCEMQKEKYFWLIFRFKKNFSYFCFEYTEYEKRKIASTSGLTSGNER